MDYAIKIALRAKGKTSPNPLVGCVIVHQDRIISEGWHIAYGQDHAERMAILNINSEDQHLLTECVLYVTLEPCNHIGKTPPCSELIIQSGIKNIVFGCLDPNPLMSGHSIEILNQKGISLIGPIREFQCKNLIETFALPMTQKRPYVILKWAQSSDNFMGIENHRTKISNHQSDILVHKWRSEVNGILTSYNTWKIDRPQLNVRYWTGKNPKKFVLSSNKEHLNDIIQTDEDFTPVLNSNSTNLLKILQTIYEEHRIGILLIEAGPSMLQKFIDENLWDESRIITNQELKLHKGLRSPLVQGKIISNSRIFSDKIVIIKNTSSPKPLKLF